MSSLIRESSVIARLKQPVAAQVSVALGKVEDLCDWYFHRGEVLVHASRENIPKVTETVRKQFPTAEIVV